MELAAESREQTHPRIDDFLHSIRSDFEGAGLIDTPHSILPFLRRERGKIAYLLEVCNASNACDKYGNAIAEWLEDSEEFLKLGFGDDPPISWTLS